ncbi:MAG: hypothetical protein ABJH06_07200 [Paraglaciecola sp.]|uniref:hypothetical protein n=1 Tax=Paraglaciecola sp. TaxID=1920173 RepID=UPI0032976F45
MSTENVRLILHPGMPKCASSSVQTSLISNREVLRKKNVFVLGADLRIRIETSKDKPHGIPYSIIKKCVSGEVSLTRELQQCCKEIKKDFNVSSFDLVLSSELLGFIGRKDGWQLHEELASIFNDTLVVIIVRNPWQHIFSNWRQGVYRQGLTFKDFSNQKLSTFQNDADYWGSKLSLFELLYDEVKVLSLDISSDIVSDFYFQFLTNVEDLKTISKKSNKSLSPIFCEIMSEFPEDFTDELTAGASDKKGHKNMLKKICIDEVIPSTIFSDTKLKSHTICIQSLKEHFMSTYLSSLEKYGIYSDEDINGYARKVSVTDSSLRNIDVSDEATSFSESKRMLAELLRSMKSFN